MIWELKNADKAPYMTPCPHFAVKVDTFSVSYIELDLLSGAFPVGESTVLPEAEQAAADCTQLAIKASYPA